ncbi:AraC family transcriptional regulator [Chitinophaga nivalis]|uniref:AraC family transcriptional regulator n=1 Tax=Chitinophaga nivalis TaxID=2991709 RepID=A0ABT3IMI7_9BACT|nr:helix-turn-helix transcriptional regulator [Chitinophaga nivalis]MCW3465114.1 AraC family transcriptional regulator [Chitinophaga nivalis]MCW3485194.1 AraC family transcriptional regulator [Chitinophaga nivalis]
MRNNKSKIPTFKVNNFQRSFFVGRDEKGDTYPLPATQFFEIERIDNLFNKCEECREPHRIDFYFLLLLTGGEGVHTFDDQEHYIKENTLCFVNPDMVTSWNSQTDYQQGYSCSFSEEFIHLGRENKRFLHELPFFKLGGSAVLPLQPEQAQYYATLLEQMCLEKQRNTIHSPDILRTLLQLFLQKVQSEFGPKDCQLKTTNNSGLRLTKAFMDLYHQDFDLLRKGKINQPKQISAYAEVLGITQNHMNDTVKEVTGKSAGQHIQDRLTKEATMLLMQSHLSVSEIAFKLGFNDPSYFSRFYKKNTGVSPSALR